MESWHDRLEALDEEQRELVLGSSLSQRFAAWPLYACHPAIVGAFYGLLITCALLLPVGWNHDWSVVPWLSEVATRGVTIMLSLGLLGHASLMMNMFIGRPPAQLAKFRVVLFGMPFVGFGLLMATWSGMTTAIPDMLFWSVMLFPGPAYVHLSWAPRYRILSMLEDGKDPFGPVKIEVGKREKERELEAAVDALVE